MRKASYSFTSSEFCQKQWMNVLFDIIKKCVETGDSPCKMQDDLITSN